jgi:hypothetical protein
MTWEKTLKSMVGDAGYETLQKAIYKKDSDATLGPLDIYLPLLVVPRAILSWLVQNIKPMAQNENKKLEFPGIPGVLIDITKTGRDSYRATFIEKGKVVHEFEKQTLPNIGGQLLTFGELYTEDSAVSLDQPKEDLSAPSQMLSMMGGIPSPANDVQWQTISSLTGAIGKLVDALVCNQMVKDNVKKALNTKKKDEEPEEEEEESTEEESEDEEEVKKTGIAENAAGAAIPKQPIKPQAPQKPSRGPAIKPKPIAPMSAPSAIKPKPSANAYFKSKAPKIITKSEPKEHVVLESELYTPCPHCGVPEFRKTEKGPKYKPCACFSVTLTNDDNKKTSFVSIIKKSEGKFALSFNKNADPESIETLLLTLRRQLLKYKEDL